MVVQVLAVLVVWRWDKTFCVEDYNRFQSRVFEIYIQSQKQLRSFGKISSAIVLSNASTFDDIGLVNRHVGRSFPCWETKEDLNLHGKVDCLCGTWNVTYVCRFQVQDSFISNRMQDMREVGVVRWASVNCTNMHASSGQPVLISQLNSPFSCSSCSSQSMGMPSVLLG